MGAANVRLVYERWGHLPDRAFRVLAFMALTSLDNDAMPRYWGGSKALAGALGRHNEDDEPLSAKDQAAVKGALGDLRRAGAIVQITNGRVGQTSIYSLPLHGEGQAHPAPEGCGHSAPEGERGPTPEIAGRGRVTLNEGEGDPQRGGGSPSPLGIEEEVQEEEQTLAPLGLVEALFGTAVKTPASKQHPSGRPDPDFTRFYFDAYPLRKERRRAEAAWGKARERASAEAIIAGAIRYRDDPNRRPGYTKHPATWLNAGCWDDDPEPARSDGPQGYGSTNSGPTPLVRKPGDGYSDRWSSGHTSGFPGLIRQDDAS